MAELTYNSGYVTEGLGRLLGIFKGKPRIAAWLTSYLREFQAAEDALFAVYADRLLQTDAATGDLLAKLGKLVGQTNEGLTDDQFRFLIRARIQANRSRGWRTNMLAVASLLTGDAPIVAHDYPIASFLLSPQAQLILPPQLVVNSFLGKAIGAGIWFMFVFTLSPPANTLTFGSVHGGPTPTINQSPGSVYTSGTQGGVFGGAVHTYGGISQ